MRLHPYFTILLSFHQFPFIQAHHDLRNSLVLRSELTLYNRYTSKDSKERKKMIQKKFDGGQKLIQKS